MKIGAHISTAGGAHTAFERALAIGAECLQFFESPPQQWGTAKLTDEQIEAFHEKKAESELEPLFIHGKYLMNLASADPKIFKTSQSTLRSSLNIAGRLGVKGIIFHTGSHKGLSFEAVFERICRAATEVLDETPPETLMIFENAAGQQGTIGSKFSELGEMLRRIDNPRARVCIDTCHAFAAGYDLSSVEGVAGVMAELEREIGTSNIAAVHCNDSKGALGSGRDLHENIGEGFIGRDGFMALVARPELQDVPFVLEVPGYKIDGAGKGPDKPNIDLMKAIRAAVQSGGPVPPAPLVAGSAPPARKAPAKKTSARKSSG
jgi:deoxyribonuclease-4